MNVMDIISRFKFKDYEELIYCLWNVGETSGHEVYMEDIIAALDDMTENGKNLEV